MHVGAGNGVAERRRGGKRGLAERERWLSLGEGGRRRQREAAGDIMH